MVSPENMHVSNIMQTEKVIVRNTYVFTCSSMPITRINVKGGQRFKREQGGLYGKVCMEERKEKKDFIS